MEPLANGFERAEVVVLGQELVGAGPLVWGQEADLQAVQQRLLVGGGRSQALPQAPSVKRRRARVQLSGLNGFASPLWLPQRICAARDRLLERPGRAEPRAVKRRPKNFRLLTQPRHAMVIERSRKQSQKPSKKPLI